MLSKEEIKEISNSLDKIEREIDELNEIIEPKIKEINEQKEKEEEERRRKRRMEEEERRRLEEEEEEEEDEKRRRRGEL